MMSKKTDLLPKSIREINIISRRVLIAISDTLKIDLRFEIYDSCILESKYKGVN